MYTTSCVLSNQTLAFAETQITHTVANKAEDRGIALLVYIYRIKFKLRIFKSISLLKRSIYCSLKLTSSTRDLA